jgi:hypothetical protein
MLKKWTMFRCSLDYSLLNMAAQILLFGSIVFDSHSYDASRNIGMMQHILFSERKLHILRIKWLYYHA